MTIPNAMDVLIGSRITAAREAKGLSQTDLAETLNIAPEQLQTYEDGSTQIDATLLYMIAVTLGLSIRSFYEGTTKAQAFQRRDRSNEFRPANEYSRLGKDWE